MICMPIFSQILVTSSQPVFITYKAVYDLCAYLQSNPWYFKPDYLLLPTHQPPVYDESCHVNSIIGESITWYLILLKLLKLCSTICSHFRYTYLYLIFLLHFRAFNALWVSTGLLNRIWRAKICHCAMAFYWEMPHFSVWKKSGIVWKKSGILYLRLAGNPE